MAGFRQEEFPQCDYLQPNLERPGPKLLILQRGTFLQHVGLQKEGQRAAWKAERQEQHTDGARRTAAACSMAIF